jgi:hypothetical protein
MAVGDVVTIIPTSVANNGFLDIRPPSGQEWTIQNLEYSGAVELYKTDGTTSIKVDSDTSGGGMVGRYYNATNTVYWQLKNVSGSAANLSYDGKQIK